MTLRLFGIVAVCTLLCGRSFGGGGGENMLLVVNPNDPASLQIANAYAALRDIPASNILYLAPPPDYNNDGSPIPQSEVMPDYLTPIANAIASRGLTGQINYIGTIGQAVSYSISADSGIPSTTANSLSYALSLLTPLTNGSGLTLQGAVSHYSVPQNTLFGATSGLYQNPSYIPINGAADAAVQHSASYSVTYYSTANSPGTVYTTQYYMSGAIGYTGTNGNTVAQVISSLRSAASADGTHPTGTIFFENSGDGKRSGPRIPEWSFTESQLSARGISWIEESGTTPLNRNNVLGATTGAATLTLPNGSTYLPGAWADNLTSYGCDFPDTSQTKATAFITAGAAGTTGSVVEPYNFTQRFTNSSIDTFIADGATLGEAFAKSVATPDVQLPLGDMLAQPMADVPTVVINSGPGNYGAAQGTISIGGSAGLSGARIATGISELELLVDGMVSSTGTLAGGSGNFSLSTTDLSDGVHEVRVVAVNNAQAASEGYLAEPIVVNNHGRSIGFDGGNTTLNASTATFNLATAAGDGTISQVELTCLGRVVAQASGSPGSLSLSPASLAPGDNNIVPVAVFSDGSQVAGGAFVVHVEGGSTNAWTDGAATALWGNSGNWSGGTTPQNGDGVARFTGPSGGTVTMAGSTSVQGLDFGGSGGNYTLSASSGQALTLSSSSGPMSQSMINVLGGNQTISAPLVFSAPGNLISITNVKDRLTISGGISGMGALTETGAGTLVLTGSNTYGGTTTISAGTLQLAASGTLGTGSVVDNSVLQLNRSDTYTLANAISGVGALSHNGAGTLILAGSNSYSGGTRVNAGNIVFGSAAALPGSGKILLGSSGALNITGAYSTVTGWLNSGTIDPASTGVLALTGTSNENINMSGYGGLALGASAPGATYGGTMMPSGTAYAFGGGGGALTVASNLAGALGVVVGNSEPGTAILSGSNTYTGDTTVTNGALDILYPWSVPDGGNLTVGNSGWFQFQSVAVPPLGSAASAEIVSPRGASAVPEPGTLLIFFATGACGLLWHATRRVRRQS